MEKAITEADKTDDIKKNSEMNNHYGGKYVVFICIFLLAVTTTILFIQNNSVKDKLSDQETINEGLLSENLELENKLEDYYDDYYVNKASMEKSNHEIISLQNELSNANEKIKLLQNEITLLEEERGDEEDIRKELDIVRKKLDESNGDNEKFKDIYNELLLFLDSEYLGTEQYYTDQYFIFTDGEEKEITITAKSSKKYTTSVVGNNNNITTEWEKQFEGYQAKLKFIPKVEGTTQFTFTNSFNSDNFKVIVVYLKI